MVGQIKVDVWCGGSLFVSHWWFWLNTSYLNAYGKEYTPEYVNEELVKTILTNWLWKHLCI